MISEPFKYAYLITSFLFLAVWFLIFWQMKLLRKPMLILSLLTASFGPISELWYFADYWRPEIALSLPLIGGMEDLIFGFAIGGIAAFVFESLFVKNICYCESKKTKKEWFLLVFFAIEGAAMIVLNNFLSLNSIFASSLGMIATASIMLYLRPDLIVNALASAFLVAFAMFAIYFLGQTFFSSAHLWMSRIWLLYGKAAGIILFKHVPATEMLWGLSWGLVWGPMYEFLSGARTMRLKI